MYRRFWGALLRQVSQACIWRSLLAVLICLPLFAVGRSLATAAGSRAGSPAAAVAAASPRLRTGARVLVVTSLADYPPAARPIPGSLRYAIAHAAAGDTITFGVAGTITLQGTIPISTSLTIQGPGPTFVTIDGGHRSTLFAIAYADAAGAPIRVTLSGLTLENGSGAGTMKPGQAAEGGAIQSFGALTLSQMVFRDNHAAVVTTPGISGGGGAIAQLGGSLSISGTTFVGNTAGGLGLGGAVLIAGCAGAPAGSGYCPPASPGLPALSVLNSTFADNTALSGGALSISDATAAISGTTFAGNTAIPYQGRSAALTHAGALEVGSSTVSVQNSTFFGNSSFNGAGAIGFNSSNSTLVLDHVTIVGNNGATSGTAGYPKGAAIADENTQQPPAGRLEHQEQHRRQQHGPQYRALLRYRSLDQEPRSQ
jgi:hypothetical protein